MKNLFKIASLSVIVILALSINASLLFSSPSLPEADQYWMKVAWDCSNDNECYLRCEPCYPPVAVCECDIMEQTFCALCYIITDPIGDE